MKSRLLRNAVLAIAIVPLGQAAAEIPSSMIDFDRQVGFSTPLSTPVFRGFNDDHLYFVFPNVISFDKLDTGAPDITLVYDKSGGGKTAFLAVSGTVGFASDHTRAVDEIKAGDPSAKFVTVEPSEFSFTMNTPGSNGKDAVIDSARLDSTGHFEILARVDDITTRILLLPQSYKFDAIAIVYAPVYRGVVRAEDGTPTVKTRSYSVGAVDGGGCALSPERYQSWATKQTGCKHPAYPRQLVKRIQTLLKQRGLFRGGVDGVYGPITEAAIRQYQTANKLVADGLPSQELAVNIGGTQQAAN